MLVPDQRSGEGSGARRSLRGRSVIAPITDTPVQELSIFKISFYAYAYHALKRHGD